MADRSVQVGNHTIFLIDEDNHNQGSPLSPLCSGAASACSDVSSVRKSILSIVHARVQPEVFEDTLALHSNSAGNIIPAEGSDLSFVTLIGLLGLPSRIAAFLISHGVPKRRHCTGPSPLSTLDHHSEVPVHAQDHVPGTKKPPSGFHESRSPGVVGKTMPQIGVRGKEPDEIDGLARNMSQALTSGLYAAWLHGVGKVPALALFYWSHTLTSSAAEASAESAGALRAVQTITSLATKVFLFLEVGDVSSLVDGYAEGRAAEGMLSHSTSTETVPSAGTLRASRHELLARASSPSEKRAEAPQTPAEKTPTGSFLKFGRRICAATGEGTKQQVKARAPQESSLGLMLRPEQDGHRYDAGTGKSTTVENQRLAARDVEGATGVPFVNTSGQKQKPDAGSALGEGKRGAQGKGEEVAWYRGQKYRCFQAFGRPHAQKSAGRGKPQLSLRDAGPSSSFPLRAIDRRHLAPATEEDARARLPRSRGVPVPDPASARPAPSASAGASCSSSPREGRQLFSTSRGRTLSCDSLQGWPLLGNDSVEGHGAGTDSGRRMSVDMCLQESAAQADAVAPQDLAILGLSRSAKIPSYATSSLCLVQGWPLQDEQPPSRGHAPPTPAVLIGSLQDGVPQVQQGSKQSVTMRTGELPSFLRRLAQSYQVSVSHLSLEGTFLLAYAVEPARWGHSPLGGWDTWVPYLHNLEDEGDYAVLVEAAQASIQRYLHHDPGAPKGKARRLTGLPQGQGASSDGLPRATVMRCTPGNGVVFLDYTVENPDNSRRREGASEKHWRVWSAAGAPESTSDGFAPSSLLRASAHGRPCMDRGSIGVGVTSPSFILPATKQVLLCHCLSPTWELLLVVSDAETGFADVMVTRGRGAPEVLQAIGQAVMCAAFHDGSGVLAVYREGMEQVDVWRLLRAGETGWDGATMRVEFLRDFRCAMARSQEQQQQEQQQMTTSPVWLGWANCAPIKDHPQTLSGQSLVRTAHQDEEPTLCLLVLDAAACLLTTFVAQGPGAGMSRQVPLPHLNLTGKAVVVHSAARPHQGPPVLLLLSTTRESEDLPGAWRESGHVFVEASKLLRTWSKPGGRTLEVHALDLVRLGVLWSQRLDVPCRSVSELELGVVAGCKAWEHKPAASSNQGELSLVLLQRNVATVVSWPLAMHGSHEAPLHRSSMHNAQSYPDATSMGSDTDNAHACVDIPSSSGRRMSCFTEALLSIEDEESTREMNGSAGQRLVPSPRQQPSRLVLISPEVEDEHLPRIFAIFCEEAFSRQRQGSAGLKRFSGVLACSLVNVHKL